MTNYTTTSTAANSSLMASLFKSLYMQMAAALSLTGLTAYLLSGSEAYWTMLMNNPSILWIALFAELGVVMWLSARVMNMSMGAATALFILYSVLNGVTLSRKKDFKTYQIYERLFEKPLRRTRCGLLAQSVGPQSGIRHLLRADGGSEMGVWL